MHKSQQHGESWNGDYFRNTVLADLAIPFLRDPDNVLDVNEVTFLHDKAPCMKAIATQLLRVNSVDFFDNSLWPGSSPDLNVAENIGAIMKNRSRRVCWPLKNKRDVSPPFCDKHWIPYWMNFQTTLNCLKNS